MEIGDDVGLRRDWGWRAMAMGGIVVASWLSGVVMQGTSEILPTGCDCGGSGCRGLQRRMEEDRERLSSMENEVSKMRREFDRHLSGRGVGVPVGSPSP